MFCEDDVLLLYAAFSSVFFSEDENADPGLESMDRRQLFSFLRLGLRQILWEGRVEMSWSSTAAIRMVLQTQRFASTMHRIFFPFGRPLNGWAFVLPPTGEATNHSFLCDPRLKPITKFG
jgi:hypothetical protein